MKKITTAWIFIGELSTFPSGVFLSRELADAWIAQHQLSGSLSPFPVNTGAYDYAIETGAFTPTKESEKTSEFIQKFNASKQEHFFYKYGVSETNVELTSYPLGDFFVEVCHLGRSPVTGKWQVSVEVSKRDGTVLASSGKITSDDITNELLTKLLPQKFSDDQLSAIVESAWKDKFVL